MPSICSSYHRKLPRGCHVNALPYLAIEANLSICGPIAATCSDYFEAWVRWQMLPVSAIPIFSPLGLVMTSNFILRYRQFCALICRVWPDSFPGPRARCTRGSPRVLNEPTLSSQPEHEQTSSFLPPLCLALTPLPPPPRHPISSSSSTMP